MELERRTQLWAGAGAVALFIGLGLLMSPGLLSSSRGADAPEFDTSANRVRASAGSSDARTTGSAETTSATARERRADAPLIATPFDCMVQPNDIVEIGSPITGLIEQVRPERTQFVNRGDIVVQLESAVERAAVASARERAQQQGEIDSSRASLELGERRRARGQELFDNQSVSLDVRETLETEAKLAEAGVTRAIENRKLAELQLAQAEATLRRRTIRTPVSGYVIERLMSPGEVVEDETILRIAEVNPLRVEVILPAELFGRIRPGDRAEIVPEAPLDAARSAEVALVDPVIDGASATFGAQLLLPNPDLSLPAGLRCIVRFADPGREQAAANEDSADHS